MRRSSITILVAALVALLVPALHASASPPDHVSHQVATTLSERSAAVDYWTPERMENARPASTLLPADAAHIGRPVESGSPSTVGPEGPSTDGSVAPRHHRPWHRGGGTTTQSGAPWTGGGLVASTTGKVFFTLGAIDYVCSGSVVTSNNQSTVLTAGHCLHSGFGGPVVFASNFVFVPAYDGNGSTVTGPYGVWAATNLYTTGQWAWNGNLDYDIGFARVETKPEGTISQVVGSQGIAFNQPRGEHVYAFGYPAAPPYSGDTLIHCSGTTINDPYGRSTMGVLCDMTGGSSGGPWYRTFNTSSGTGIATSVNSYGYTSGPYTDYMFGPYFGSVAQSLYEAAQS
jgi:V8-like Glu-specific endopeptidase